MKELNKILLALFLIVFSGVIFFWWHKNLRDKEEIEVFKRELFEKSKKITDSLSREKRYWTRDSLLTWQDFLAKKDSNYSDSACIKGKVEYSLIWLPADKVEVIVNAVIRKNLSWVKKGNEDSRLLSHEQGHFNLFELYARQFRKRIGNMKFEKPSQDLEERYIRQNNEIVRTLDSALQQERDKMRLVQRKYDQITNHGVNLQLQKEWERIIFLKMDSLREYKDTVVNLNLWK